jgi:hypothetical protein
MKIRTLVLTGVVGGLLLVGSVFAQEHHGRGRPDVWDNHGPAPRHDRDRDHGHHQDHGRWDRGPAHRPSTKKGFCFSMRTGECSEIFRRDTEQEIANECGRGDWRRYFAFDHGHDAEEQHRLVCREIVR